MRQSVVVLFFFASFDAQFVEYHAALLSVKAESPATKTPFSPVLDLMPNTIASSPGSLSPS
jgi:hypothetical protein